MSMPKIELPGLTWFKGGNIYTGSFGTNPQYGFMNIYTAEYKAFFHKDETGLQLKASWRIRPPWNEPQDTETIEKVFDASAEGIHEAEQWLSDEIQKSLEIHKTK